MKNLLYLIGLIAIAAVALSVMKTNSVDVNIPGSSAVEEIADFTGDVVEEGADLVEEGADVVVDGLEEVADDVVDAVDGDDTTETEA